MAIVLLGHLVLWGLFQAAGQTLTPLAEQSPSDPGVVNPIGQPTQHYYGAIGVGVRVYWEIDRPAIVEGEPFVLTLVVERVRNPGAVQRPDLRQLEPFAQCLELVDPQPVAQVDTAAASVRFPYRVRWRRPDLSEIPPLLFYYFNPAAPEGKQYSLTVAASRRVQIMARAPATTQAAAPLPADPLWWELVDEEAIAQMVALSGRRAGSFEVEPVFWLVGFIGPPLAAWLIYRWWRWRFPIAARLARLQRTRLARRTVRLLNQAVHDPQPWSAFRAAILAYLQQRWQLPPGLATPDEVMEALRQRQLPKDPLYMLHTLLSQWDQHRFAPHPLPGEVLAYHHAAMVLLTQLEEWPETSTTPVNHNRVNGNRPL
ncbi:MAG: hypothetical protein NZ703_03790 [Gemmataceae bacterium]|nr:hypothetical protein [Gemmataceae bacterium]